MSLADDATRQKHVNIWYYMWDESQPEIKRLIFLNDETQGQLDIAETEIKIQFQRRSSSGSISMV